MDLKDYSRYYNQQYRHHERRHCYCENCKEELHPYCLKHNDPIKEYFPQAISCGTTECRQDFISYYSPSRGCRYCRYGQDNRCDYGCNYSQIYRLKGCTYCQHPLVNGIQIFDCETPLETAPEPDDYQFETTLDNFKITPELEHQITQLKQYLIDNNLYQEFETVPVSNDKQHLGTSRLNLHVESEIQHETNPGSDDELKNIFRQRFDMGNFLRKA